MSAELSWALWALGVVVVFAFSFWALGLVVIDGLHSGLVVRRYGRSLPPGRVVASGGEAGYQAQLLPPGWHVGYWPWRYTVERVPLVEVPPGEIGLVTALDGADLPAGNNLGRAVPCDGFQDGAAFLDGGGQKGRQSALLTAGRYRINPALFQVITAQNAAAFGLAPSDLAITVVPPESVGVVTTLDGAPVPTGDLAGPPVDGHDCYQDAQAFLSAGGCRGLQETVLLSGAWTLNPWFVKVELVPLTEVPIGYVGVVVSYVGGEHVDVSGDA